MGPRFFSLMLVGLGFIATPVWAEHVSTDDISKVSSEANRDGLSRQNGESPLEFLQRVEDYVTVLNKVDKHGITGTLPPNSDVSDSVGKILSASFLSADNRARAVRILGSGRLAKTPALRKGFVRSLVLDDNPVNAATLLTVARDWWITDRPAFLKLQSGSESIASVIDGVLARHAIEGTPQIQGLARGLVLIGDPAETLAMQKLLLHNSTQSDSSEAVQNRDVLADLSLHPELAADASLITKMAVALKDPKASPIASKVLKMAAERPGEAGEAVLRQIVNQLGSGRQEGAVALLKGLAPHRVAKSVAKKIRDEEAVGPFLEAVQKNELVDEATLGRLATTVLTGKDSANAFSMAADVLKSMPAKHIPFKQIANAWDPTKAVRGQVRQGAIREVLLNHADKGVEAADRALVRRALVAFNPDRPGEFPHVNVMLGARTIPVSVMNDPATQKKWATLLRNPDVGTAARAARILGAATIVHSGTLSEIQKAIELKNRDINNRIADLHKKWTDSGKLKPAEATAYADQLHKAALRALKQNDEAVAYGWLRVTSEFGQHSPALSRLIGGALKSDQALLSSWAEKHVNRLSLTALNHVPTARRVIELAADGKMNSQIEEALRAVDPDIRQSIIFTRVENEKDISARFIDFLSREGILDDPVLQKSLATKMQNSGAVGKNARALLGRATRIDDSVVQATRLFMRGEESDRGYNLWKAWQNGGHLSQTQLETSSDHFAAMAMTAMKEGNFGRARRALKLVDEIDVAAPETLAALGVAALASEDAYLHGWGTTRLRVSVPTEKIDFGKVAKAWNGEHGSRRDGIGQVLWARKGFDLVPIVDAMRSQARVITPGLANYIHKWSEAKNPQEGGAALFWLELQRLAHGDRAVRERAKKTIAQFRVKDVRGFDASVWRTLIALRGGKPGTEIANTVDALVYRFKDDVDFEKVAGDFWKSKQITPDEKHNILSFLNARYPGTTLAHLLVDAHFDADAGLRQRAGDMVKHTSPKILLENPALIQFVLKTALGSSDEPSAALTEAARLMEAWVKTPQNKTRLAETINEFVASHSIQGSRSSLFPLLTGYGRRDSDGYVRNLLQFSQGEIEALRGPQGLALSFLKEAGKVLTPEQRKHIATTYCADAGPMCAALPELVRGWPSADGIETVILEALGNEETRAVALKIGQEGRFGPEAMETLAQGVAKVLQNTEVHEDNTRNGLWKILDRLSPSSEILEELVRNNANDRLTVGVHSSTARLLRARVNKQPIVRWGANRVHDCLAVLGSIGMGKKRR